MPQQAAADEGPAGAVHPGQQDVGHLLGGAGIPVEPRPLRQPPAGVRDGQRQPLPARRLPGPGEDVAGVRLPAAGAQPAVRRQVEGVEHARLALRQRRREARLGLVPGSVEGLEPMFLDAHQVDELAQVVLGGVSDSGGDDLVRVGEPAQAQQQLPEVAVRPRGGLVAAVRQGDRQRGLQVRDPGRGLLDLGPGEAAVVQHERRQVRSPRRVRELARPFQHGQRRGGPTGQDETRAVVGRGGRQRGAGGGRLQRRHGTRAEPFGLLALAGHEQVPREPHEHGGDSLRVRRGRRRPAPAAPAPCGRPGRVGEPVGDVELPRAVLEERGARAGPAGRRERPPPRGAPAPGGATRPPRRPAPRPARTRRSSRRRRPARRGARARDGPAPSRPRSAARRPG